jgi:acyl carrier protein
MISDELAIVQLKDLPLYERQFFLKSYLTVLFADYLHIDKSELSGDSSLFELGLTSLLAVEIKYILEVQLQVKLRSTVLFDYPTLNKLNNFIQREKLLSLFQSKVEA